MPLVEVSKRTSIRQRSRYVSRTQETRWTRALTVQRQTWNRLSPWPQRKGTRCASAWLRSEQRDAPVTPPVLHGQMRDQQTDGKRARGGAGDEPGIGTRENAPEPRPRVLVIGRVAPVSPPRLPGNGTTWRLLLSRDRPVHVRSGSRLPACERHAIRSSDDPEWNDVARRGRVAGVIDAGIRDREQHEYEPACTQSDDGRENQHWSDRFPLSPPRLRHAHRSRRPPPRKAVSFDAATDLSPTLRRVFPDEEP